jgi:IS5 family transposase
MLNQKHPLFVLASQIDWLVFEQAFAPLYCLDNGRPAKPIRLMVGLLILKHLRNVSDENIVEQWSENNYYQYFCGELNFIPIVPCEASELVHFRKRIGESGIELIFKESIRVNGKDGQEQHVSFVQEKNITYPTDAKLHRKIIAKCQAISNRNGMKQRQSYTFVLKKLGVDQRFRNHPKNKGKARKADKKVRTIAGRLVRELERNLRSETYAKEIKRVLAQKKTDKNKVYSLHEPEVKCISKGKEHKKYEFGNKVSIIYTQTTGVIVGAMGFRNEYDGHTLEPALAQHKKLTGRPAKSATVDRGYQGRAKIGETEITIPKPLNNRSLSKHRQTKLRKEFRRRAAIEPVIGHLKSDHRLGRNFYKGIFGDNINIMLAAAAFNFKRMYNKYRIALLSFFFNCLKCLLSKSTELSGKILNSKSNNIKPIKPIWAF